MGAFKNSIPRRHWPWQGYLILGLRDLLLGLLLLNVIGCAASTARRSSPAGPSSPVGPPSVATFNMHPIYEVAQVNQQFTTGQQQIVSLGNEPCEDPVNPGNVCFFCSYIDTKTGKNTIYSDAVLWSQSSWTAANQGFTLFPQMGNPSINNPQPGDFASPMVSYRMGTALYDYSGSANSFFSYLFSGGNQETSLGSTGGYTQPNLAFAANSINTVYGVSTGGNYFIKLLSVADPPPTSTPSTIAQQSDPAPGNPALTSGTNPTPNSNGNGALTWCFGFEPDSATNKVAAFWTTTGPQRLAGVGGPVNANETIYVMGGTSGSPANAWIVDNDTAMPDSPQNSAIPVLFGTFFEQNAPFNPAYVRSPNTSVVGSNANIRTFGPGYRSMSGVAPPTLVAFYGQSQPQTPATNNLYGIYASVYAHPGYPGTLYTIADNLTPIPGVTNNGKAVYFQFFDPQVAVGDNEVAFVGGYKSGGQSVEGIYLWQHWNAVYKPTLTPIVDMTCSFNDVTSSSAPLGYPTLFHIGRDAIANFKTTNQIVFWAAFSPTVSGIYAATLPVGSLTVNIALNPPVPPGTYLGAKGRFARWQVNGNVDRLPSGATVLLPPGTYSVGLTPMPGYNQPLATPVTISNLPLTITLTYTQSP
ncbi:MAG: hypothetical protein ABSC42_17675 [Tepidisphaeraceae bacterium]